MNEMKSCPAEEDAFVGRGWRNGDERNGDEGQKEEGRRCWGLEGFQKVWGVKAKGEGLRVRNLMPRLHVLGTDGRRAKAGGDPGAAGGQDCAQPDSVRGGLHRLWGWTLEPPCVPGALAPR